MLLFLAVLLVEFMRVLPRRFQCGFRPPSFRSQPLSRKVAPLDYGLANLFPIQVEAHGSLQSASSATPQNGGIAFLFELKGLL
jgi:hypothetical protein